MRFRTFRLASWPRSSLAAVVFLTAGVASGREILCTARDEGGKKVEVYANSSELAIRGNSYEGTDIAHSIISNRVRGKGAAARRVITFTGGQLVFADVYGCIKNPKIEFESGVPLLRLSCVYQGAPKCRP